jgi:hypothetical protein
MSGEVAPGNLESAMIDLARRGAILRVWGVDNEDRVALALEERRAGRDVAETPPIKPPDEDEYDTAPLVEPEEEGVPELEPEPEPEVKAAAPEEKPKLELQPEPELEPELEPEPEPRVEPASSAEPTAIDIRPPGSVAESEARTSQPPNLDEPFDREEPGREHPKSEPPPLPLSGEATIEEPVETIDASLVAPKVSKEASELAKMAESIEKRRSKPPKDDDAEPSLLGWVTMLALFGVVGFISMSAISRSCASDDADSQQPVVDAATTQAAPANGTRTDEGGEERAPAPPRPEELAFGETIAGVDAGPNLRVGRGQGLLVIEAGQGAAPEVFIGSRSLGRVPIREALDEGRYELRYERGDEESYRFVFVRAGQTRVIPPL